MLHSLIHPLVMYLAHFVKDSDYLEFLAFTSITVLKHWKDHLWGFIHTTSHSRVSFPSNSIFHLINPSFTAISITFFHFLTSHSNSSLFLFVILHLNTFCLTHLRGKPPRLTLWGVLTGWLVKEWRSHLAGCWFNPQRHLTLSCSGLISCVFHDLLLCNM